MSFSLGLSVLVQVGATELEAKTARENSANYPPKVVARCLDGILPDPSIDCSAVPASLPERSDSVKISIPLVQEVDPSCQPPTKLEDGECVLEADAALTETLLLSSGTTLDCKGHRLTPSIDGQEASWGESRRGTPFQPSVPSTPTTAVLLAGGTSNVTVENCVIDNFDFGVVIANSKLPNAAKPETRNRIINNSLNNRFRGVEIIAADGNAILGNAIHSFAGASGGISINHDSDDNLVKGNTYVGPSTEWWVPGPLFPGGTDEVTNGWSGEGVRVLGPVFSYNFKVGNRRFVGTRNPSAWAERNIIEENDIEIPNRLGNGLVAESASDRTVFRRNIVRQVSDAISLVNHNRGHDLNSKNVLVDGNTVYGPVEVGLQAASTENPVLRDNTVMNAQFAGILLAFNAFETGTVTGNVITDSENGLFLFPFGKTFGAKVSLNDFVGNALAVLGEEVEAPVELSVDGKGNFWGHTSAPGFRPTDTNEPSLITDSYPFLAPVAGWSD